MQNRAPPADVKNGPARSTKTRFYRPLSLEGGLLRNGTPDSFRLTATIAVPPNTSYLNAPLLGGLSCITVIGVAKREL